MNETLKTLHSLRTIHGNFNDQEISDADLQAIIDASVRAANASARQSYSIIVVDDHDLMKKLCGYAGSKLLLYCVDYNRILAMAEHLGHSNDADGMVSFVTGSVDTMMAAQTAIIAAKALGIDSLATNGVHRGDMQRVYDLLGLPENHCFPLIALVLGYAAEEPGYMKGRWTGAGVVHYGSYHAPTAEELDAMIATYDDPESHLGLNYGWMDKEEFAHYHDWYFKVWAGRAPKSPGTSQLYDMIVRAGFGESDE